MPRSVTQMEGSMDCQGNNHHRKKPTPGPPNPTNNNNHNKTKRTCSPCHFSFLWASDGLGWLNLHAVSQHMPFPLRALWKCPSAKFTRKTFLGVNSSPMVGKSHQICEEKAELLPVCLLWEGAEELSPHSLGPALVKPSVKAISRCLTLSPPGFSPRGVSWLVLKNHPWFPGPQPPHASSRPQLLPSQIIWGFLAQRTPNSVSAGLSSASPPSGTLCQWLPG